MKRLTPGLPVALMILSHWFSGCTERPSDCVPTYAELEHPVEVEVGNWEISTKIVAIGCRENLSSSWPPDRRQLEMALRTEWSEPHPVQILQLISERSPEIRKRVSAIINKVIGKKVVNDVLFFDARAAEDL